MITVRQECFKTLKDFDGIGSYRKNNGHGGVYLWGFNTKKEYSAPVSESDFFPYYVGKDNSCMYRRTYEHLVNLSGGGYSIFNIIDCVKGGIKIGTTHLNYQIHSNNAHKLFRKNSSLSSIGLTLPNPKYPGLLHFPEGIHLIKKFQFDTSSKIRNQVEWMLKHFCITYFYPVDLNEDQLTPELKQAYFAQLKVKLQKGRHKEEKIKPQLLLKIVNEALEAKFGNLIGYPELITEELPDSHSGLKVKITGAAGSTIVTSKSDLLKLCMG